MMPDERGLRDFLKANATVVAPGETLVIRGPDLTPNQMREYQDVMNRNFEEGFLPFRVVVVPGSGLGVVKPAELKDALRDLVREEIRFAVRSQRRYYAGLQNPGAVR